MRLRHCISVMSLSAAALGLTAPAAMADYLTIDLSSYVDTSFAKLDNTNPPYPTGLSSSNAGSPVPFNIANTAALDLAGAPVNLNYWGGFSDQNNAGNSDHGQTLKITGLSIDSTTAYTLINTTFGGSGDVPTIVTFIGSGGSRIFNLTEGVDLRDYNDGVFQNAITAALAWYDNGGPFDGTSKNQHLDMQTYDLTGLGTISEFDITEQSLTVDCQNDPQCLDPIIGGAVQDENTIFSGLTFLTARQGTDVPEPLTLSLFGAGLAGAVALRRKRKA